VFGYIRWIITVFLKTVVKGVLYCGTKSVTRIHTEAGPLETRLGDLPGDLTNKLKEVSSDAYIEDFVSGGSKNYAFSVSCNSRVTHATK
jgi:hypothetical protein